MIYGYLRVSSDEQDVNSQKQGVEQFAKDHGWEIDEYITDEGVSGGKDPDKRNLGPALKKLVKGDKLICSEISRLGRDLYMVMDILHFAMQKECVIYTVKDRFVLGDDVQSKVLAFAFGLSAEIERQMIRQRTKEGLRLRMKLGVLVGRPPGVANRPELDKCEPHRAEILKALEWGAPLRAIAKKIGVNRCTLYRTLDKWGIRGEVREKAYADWRKKEKERRVANRVPTYKDGPYKVVALDRAKAEQLIMQGLTLPQIAEYFPEYTYEQIYDTMLCDDELNPLYRKHGQLKVRKGRY